MKKIYKIKNDLSDLSLLLEQADYTITFYNSLIQLMKEKFNSNHKISELITVSEIKFENYIKQKLDFEKTESVI